MRVVQKTTAAALKYAAGRPSIGLALFGCKNRPAYRIVVLPDRAYGRPYEGSIIEEVILPLNFE
ncbi:unnamed protein product, partial [Gongylonema pulchrum]|uniref:DUF1015 domain-containing protein n=1 Tax=Gongylonema pulchrum TaxID=637853 RepID=A0A183ESS0_9BILA